MPRQPTPMLPREINPYEFKFFKKDALPLSETHKLFKSSRLLRSIETTRAISKTNQGLIVLVHKSVESVIYAPDDKVVYTMRKRSRTTPINAVARFLRAKMVDFVAMRFKNFRCCLSRWDKDICSFHLLGCVGDRTSESMLISPSELLEDVIEMPSRVENGMFRFKDLNAFNQPPERLQTTFDEGSEKKNDINKKYDIDNEYDVSRHDEREYLSNTNDVKMNPIDPENGKSNKERTLPDGQNCCIDVAGNDESRGPDSKPYREVDENEEGLLDYIISKLVRMICDEEVPEETPKEKTKPWRIIEEDDDMEERLIGSDRTFDMADEGNRGYESVIRFGVIKDGKLESVQKNVRLLSMGNFIRLEAFIIGITEYLKNTNINYVEVRSEIDFFIVKNGSTYLYIRDLIQKTESQLLKRFSRIFEKIGAGQ